MTYQIRFQTCFPGCDPSKVYEETVRDLPHLYERLKEIDSGPYDERIVWAEIKRISEPR